MVGLFLQQHYLPFHSQLFAEDERFLASRSECFLAGKSEETGTSKGKILGFGDLLKSVKHEKGNATTQEVQDLIANSRILSLKWKSKSSICIVLSDGIIIYVHIRNIFTNDYYFVIDKFFRFVEPALSAAYSRKHILFLFPDNRILLLRQGTSEEQSDKSELIQPEVTVSHYNDLLPSFASKKTEKNVTINENSDLFMVWWSGSKDDVFPWSPKPEQRANILIYSLDDNDPQLISYLKTDNTLLESTFILRNYNHMCTLEYTSEQESIVVSETIFEITRGKLTPICETSIPLQSQLKCHSYDERCKKLVLGCCDGSLVIYTQDGKVTHYTKVVFVPWKVSWHNDGFLVFVVGDRGQFQIFDIALNPLLLLDMFESSPSLMKQLVPAEAVENLRWAPLCGSSVDSILLIRFEPGVMILLRTAIGRIRLTQLCNFHLTNDHFPEAVKVLKSVFWNSEECLHVMYQIFTFLMQKRYSEDVEYNLEHLLATYFVPSFPIDETLKKKHAKPMRILARKFFMWLLVAKKYPRAFQIATSLGEPGLLKKLYIVAQSQGETELAAEVNKKLQPYFLRSSSDSSSSSPIDSHSQSSYTSSGSSDVEDEPVEPITVSIPRPELLVLEPPSPYRNPTVEAPAPKPKFFYFGEKPGTSPKPFVAENALINDSLMGESSSARQSEIEVINFGLV